MHVASQYEGCVDTWIDQELRLLCNHHFETPHHNSCEHVYKMTFDIEWDTTMYSPTKSTYTKLPAIGHWVKDKHKFIFWDWFEFLNSRKLQLFMFLKTKNTVLLLNQNIWSVIYNIWEKCFKLFEINTHRCNLDLEAHLMKFSLIQFLNVKNMLLIWFKTLKHINGMWI